jgi:hypothetical protein
VISVEKDGEYEFSTFRWPEESNKRIAENREGDKTAAINKAQLLIGNIQSAVDVTPDMKFARFTVHLKAGTTCLQAWFLDENQENQFVANFVSVKRIGPPDSAALSKYLPSNPDHLLKKL